MNLAVEAINKTFDADQLGEFLETVEEFGLAPEEHNDEYTVHLELTGFLVAYFCAVPTQGPAGGWINYTHIS
jgi:hypothetical protein